MGNDARFLHQRKMVVKDAHQRATWSSLPYWIGIGLSLSGNGPVAGGGIGVVPQLIEVQERNFLTGHFYMESLITGRRARRSGRAGVRNA
ncbi:MAG: hypothetical protein V2B18_04795 [Pseudomonadota bacterium]